MTATSRPPALSMRGITKAFGPVKALADADLRVERGTIHGLVGQNGAGKSTIIKILAGLFRPDRGTIEIDGEPQTHLNPRQVEARGIHIIHQDRLLVPTFTVGESLFLGHEGGFGAFGLLNRRRMQRQAGEALRRYFSGIDLPIEALIADLTTAQQKIVQITRALLNRPSILVLDEPTAALNKGEVDTLFTTLRGLRDEGISVIFISHYMQEIENLCDRVTILRNGKDVGTVDPRTTPIGDIVAMMIARDIKEMFPGRKRKIGAPALEIRDLTVKGKFEDVSLSVRRGEIVGITGLIGSGAKEFLQTIYGLRRADGGQVLIGGKRVVIDTPAKAVAHGVALVPEDRRSHGVALDLSIRENVTLSSLSRYGSMGFIHAGRERSGVDALIGELDVKAAGREVLVRKLSGGNQQKVVLAKWLSRESSVYLLDEPTVGVDVGSKVEIYQLLSRLAEKGAGILVLSTDLIELMGICDHLVVLYRGRVVVALRTAETDTDDVLKWATGAQASTRPDMPAATMPAS